MDPTEINSVYWDDKTKSWAYEIIPVEEYHGFVECQHCHKPLSHNIKTGGEFKVVYVKCGCSRTWNLFYFLSIMINFKYDFDV